MPNSKPNLRECLLKSKRTAMLVIHGIGQQKPYETLDNFARHLADFFADQCGFRPEITPEKVEHEDWVEVCIHLTTPERGPGRQRGEIDLYEYYWAPCTEDKITYRQVLSWLARTTLSPMRYLAMNLEVETAEGHEGAVRSFLRELLRMVGLYLPLLAGLVIGMFLYGSPTAKPVQNLLQALRTWRHAPHVVLITGMLVLCALGAYFLIFAASSFRKLVGHKSIQPRAERIWGILATIAGVVSLLVAWFLGPAAGFATVQSRLHLLEAVFHQLIEFVPLLFFALWIYFVQEYLGDVAVYVNTDQKAKNYAARAEILNGSSTALTRLLKAKVKDEQIGERWKYDEVLLVGHSLGSVIAYDTIDELLARCDATHDQLAPRSEGLHIDQQELEKLTGLVTFGSPLDKIYYFFREHVASDQAIRAQILSYLHSFRKVPSHRQYEPYKFEYTAPDLPRLKWLNAWSIMDMVSGRLQFYRVDCRQHFWYWKPLLAHLSYWGDQKFYGFVAENLLLVEAAVPAAKAAASSDTR
jgi:hypothetical protein